jgi:putative phosphoesterase
MDLNKTGEVGAGTDKEDGGPSHGKSPFVIGVISDTHGLLRPEIPEIFHGVDLIVHAGDIGSAAVLQALGDLAPVVAVKGNVDRGEWAKSLRETQVVEVEAAFLYVIHEIGRLDLKPSTAGIAAVIHGHSHMPVAEEKNGVLYLNPGSAGPRRFRLPVSVAILNVSGRHISWRMVTLEVPSGPHYPRPIWST